MQSHAWRALPACLLFGFLLSAVAADWLPGLRELVATEKRFAATCAEQGIRESFLAFFADDVITFGDGLRRGKDHLRNRPAPADPRRFRLRWLPVYGDISAAGDLGYLTGPFTVSDSRRESPPQSGTFFSIWKRSGNEWKVVVDFGNPTKTDWFSSDAVFTPAPSERRPSASAGAERVAARSAIAAREDELARLAARQGTVEAICHFAAPHLRVNRKDELPRQGKAEACAFLAAQDGRQENKLIASGVADSGDLAYTVGEVKSLSNPDERHNGAYVRVWKKNANGEWQIVLDAAN